jgi:hypothetical protein
MKVTLTSVQSVLALIIDQSLSDKKEYFIGPSKILIAVVFKSDFKNQLDLDFQAIRISLGQQLICI